MQMLREKSIQTARSRSQVVSSRSATPRSHLAHEERLGLFDVGQVVRAQVVRAPGAGRGAERGRVPLREVGPRVVLVHWNNKKTRRRRRKR
jgi:hypothetical protein